MEAYCVKCKAKKEIKDAKAITAPNQTMNFYSDPAQGHNDFLTSLAPLVEAANQYEPRWARESPV